MIHKYAHARISLEMLAMFACLGWLDHRLGDMFVQFNPNPYWIPVAAMALAYGSGPGLLAALFASGWWIVSHRVPLSLGDDPFEHVLHASLTPLLLVTAAICIGELTAYRRSMLHRSLDERARLKRDIGTISAAFDQVMAVNRDLQVRVATGDNGIAAVMAAQIALGMPKPPRFEAVAAHLISIACKEDDFTYYAVDGTKIRPVTRGFGTTRALRNIEGSALALRLLCGQNFVLATDEGGWALLEDMGVAALAIHAPDKCTIGILLFHSLNTRSQSRIGLLELADATGAIGEVFAQLSPAFRKAEREDGVPAIRNLAI